MTARVAATTEDAASHVVAEIVDVVASGRTVVASSSFQTQSMPLLHLLSRVGGVPVYFLDTGFHFPETLSFRDEVAERFGLEVLTVRSDVVKSVQVSVGGRMLFATDPDYCCHLNKTVPMEQAVATSDVWISGVRRDQSDTRRQMEPWMEGPNGTQRFHPLLDWTSRMVWQYATAHDLPSHPLDDDGFVSIGCAPCTRRDVGRDGRWFGSAKTECGLHTDLVG